MKKTLATVIAVVLCAMASAIPAQAGGQHGVRKDSIPYEGPTGIALVGHGAGTCRDGQSAVNCVQFPTGSRDHWVSVEIDDSLGGPVAAIITQGTAEPLAEFCGRIEKPVRIKPGFAVEVSLYSGSCADGTPSVATSGSVTAFFTRKK